MSNLFATSKQGICSPNKRLNDSHMSSETKIGKWQYLIILQVEYLFEI